MTMGCVMDIEQLRELAQAATPGPWTKGTYESEYAEAFERFGVHGPDGTQIVAVWENSADADYITAINPVVLLALLDMVEEMTRALHLTRASRLGESDEDRRTSE